MPFFQIDDQFHSHPKTAWLSDGAVALWTRAGSHCAAYLTDGFVDDDTVKRLGGKPRAIEQLLTVKPPHTSPLWFRVDGGYQFHDWEHYQPTAAEVKENRRKARERMKAVRANKGRTFDSSSPDVRVAQSSPSHSIPTEQDSNVSHLPKRESYPQDGQPNGVNLDAVRAAVQRHCGREASDMDCYRVIGTVMERAKSKPRSATRFVVTAIERDPFEFQKIIDEAVA